jgi:hypothetical protein
VVVVQVAMEKRLGRRVAARLLVGRKPLLVGPATFRAMVVAAAAWPLAAGVIGEWGCGSMGRRRSGEAWTWGVRPPGSQGGRAGAGEGTTAG